MVGISHYDLYGVARGTFMSLGAVCGFYENPHDTIVPDSKDREKTKHLNICEVTKFFTKGILRNPCVNERDRGNGR